MAMNSEIVERYALNYWRTWLALKDILRLAGRDEETVYGQKCRTHF